MWWRAKRAVLVNAGESGMRSTGGRDPASRPGPGKVVYIRYMTNMDEGHWVRKPWLLIAFALFAIGAIALDVLDGDTWKTVGTVGLVTALAGMILRRRTGNARFRPLVVVGFAMLGASIIMRIGLHQGWW